MNAWCEIVMKWYGHTDDLIDDGQSEITVKMRDDALQNGL